MLRPIVCSVFLCLALRVPALCGDISETSLSDSAAVKALFADPPREYATAPLWVWNDDLTDEMVVSTLRDLAAQGVKQAFVHPRPGLMTPYLSDEWFRLWKVALAEAERLDMNLWIYDENSYPSGFAGGHVPEEMPEARGRGVGMREEKAAPKWADDVIAVFSQTGDQCADVTARVKAGESLPDGTYLVFTLLRAKDSPWTAGRCYVDLMYPGVTEKFIDVTLEAYKRNIGDQFGKRVPGTFTDEPETVPAGGLPWTEHLPAEFQKRWGYSLLENLPSLWKKVGDWRRVRHNYYQVVLEQFIEHWARPMHDWCEQNHLEFTGHYWEHEWPRARYGPDNMAMYAYHQRPAIDILMNQYSEDVHAQFGNVRAVTELASVANQLGLKRTLCEAYGAAGWDSRFEDYRRIGDWMYALGVNTLDQHLSYVSLRGARKRDHPQSFSYHEPWWEAYHTQAQYFARLSAALSAGEEVNEVLVIEPTTTAWMYNAEGADDPLLAAIGNEFQQLVTDLAKRQVEFDIGCEDIIARYGSVDWVRGSIPAERVSADAPRGAFAEIEQAQLVVGHRSYRTVVLPPGVENVNAKTMDLLDEYVRRGGKVMCLGAPPARVDGSVSDRGAGLAGRGNWDQVAREAVIGRLESSVGRGLTVSQQVDDRGILFHQRRVLADSELVFLVNASLEAPARGAVWAESGSFDRMDPATGVVQSYPTSKQQTPADGFGTGASALRVRAEFEIAPAGSLLLLLSQHESVESGYVGDRAYAANPAGALDVHRVGPNVLTLDYVDVTAGGETRKDVYFYQANQFVWQKHGLERNPWDSSVQFKDELIRKTFPTDSGFEATYRFMIEGSVPRDLAIVVERPDRYTIACNGQEVKAMPGAWWLDRQFGRIEIAQVAKAGENCVTVKASPMTMYHELESAYVLGDFGLKATDHGFVIVPPEPVKLGKWNEQGQPFYCQGVAYTQKFDVPPIVPNERGRYVIALPSWYGSVAKVVVNGKPAGYIASQPYECDVSAQIVPGANSVEVTVIGTLKNTLGPHHGDPPLGSAWPAMWRKAPESGPPAGKDYSTVGYGLFEPFVLKHVEP